ncbi:hypothetical protein AB0L66_11495 [Streptomyces sp. NPDC052207]|uniref:hypothetical protein n=1 Tax=Streptomyces sp. NPDC052207 TaxID=3155418 RepID=UPI0034453830
MAYATVEEFGDYLDPDPLPANAARLLTKASRRLDRILLGAVYKTDENGLPTNPDLIEVFREAVCLQAAYIADLGDETGANANVSRMTLGNQTIERAISVVGSGTPRVSPDLMDLLQVKGLLPIRPRTRR